MAESNTVTIVGGGLVGALNAVFFAKRGWKVELYEGRPDIRGEEHVSGRSINLALSTRGREALEAVGLDKFVLEQGIPMYARLVHDPDGTLHRMPYGRPGQHIVSINRRLLNEVMLTAAEALPGVRVHFGHKLLAYKPRPDLLTFRDLAGQQDVVVPSGSLLCACDGAHSALRRSLVNRPGFDFSQEYIQHGYIELAIAPGPAGLAKFRMEQNVFHLWPRGEFTLIALANTDGTFTVTLFAPWTVLNELGARTEAERARLVVFFETHFPDATKLITRTAVVETFAGSAPSHLVSVKCAPHHLGDKVLLLGDAAHAMVPFYGQGMNAGFEDCLVLSELLDTFGEDVAATLAAYSAQRCADARSINDLAMYNYLELRDLVNSPFFKLRKKLDYYLNFMLPKTWIPLYSMVTFTRIPYHEVIQRRAWQDKTLCRVGQGSFVVFLLLLLWRLRRSRLFFSLLMQLLQRLM